MTVEKGVCGERERMRMKHGQNSEGGTIERDLAILHPED